MTAPFKRISYVDSDGYLVCGYSEPSAGELLWQKLDAVGEESQDPDDWEPA